MTELQAIIRTPQGYGYIPRSDYERLPEVAKAQVTIICVCPSEQVAQWLFQHLPQEWKERTDEMPTMRV
jgi:hypothetical protein